MAVTINNSPVHSDAKISYPYGVTDTSYSCGWHTGVDIVPYGDTESNPWLYPVFEGEVVYVNNNPNNSLGIQAQIKDNQNRYWRYCHMLPGTLSVSVGQQVTLNTQIGRLDSSGNVTGPHLHLELSSTQAWQCATFMNPCTALGIPNIDDTVIHYGGTPPPPPPTGIKNNWRNLFYKKYKVNLTK